MIEWIRVAKWDEAAGEWWWIAQTRAASARLAARTWQRLCTPTARRLVARQIRCAVAAQIHLLRASAAAQDAARRPQRTRKAAPSAVNPFSETRLTEMSTARHTVQCAPPRTGRRTNNEAIS